MLPGMKSVLVALALVLALPAAAQKAPKNERKGWFGVALKPATAEQQAELGVTRPVPRVERVFRDSPAENSGVQVGDFVVKLDDEDVADVKDLITRIGAKAPGTQVRIVLRRFGEKAPLVKNVALDLRVDMRERFKQEWLGRKMPHMVLQGARKRDGSVHLGATTPGGVTVVDYFATWCGPCKRVMPELEQLHLDYQKHGVRVVGVSSEEAEVVQPFLDDRPLVYPVALDTTGDFSHRMMVSVMPTVWVIDKQGVIRDIFFGAGHHDKLVAAVRRAVGLPAVAPRDHTPFRPGAGGPR